MKIIELWDKPENLGYYKTANIYWTKPREWISGDNFCVPDDYLGEPGLYMFIRDHKGQSEKNQIAYIGKTVKFESRLTKKHHKYDLVEKKGSTKISCGWIEFEGVRFQEEYLLQIEDIIKFSAWAYSENIQGFSSLPGFRATQKKALQPWIIHNHNFRGRLPKSIYYPSFGANYR